MDLDLHQTLAKPNEIKVTITIANALSANRPFETFIHL